MANKQKVKELVKKEGEKILWCGLGVAIGVGGVIAAYKFGTKEFPYKTYVHSNNREYIKAMRDYFAWNEGKQFAGANISTGLTDADVREKINRILGGEDSGNYLYAMVIERIKKE